MVPIITAEFDAQCEERQRSARLLSEQLRNQKLDQSARVVTELHDTITAMIYEFKSLRDRYQRNTLEQKQTIDGLERKIIELQSKKGGKK